MKKLNQKVLEQVIKLTIRGETARAGKLMEKYMAAKGAMIVNEENYAGDDPMFPARRELQRELEDDIDTDRLEDEGEPSLDGLDGDVEGGLDDEECLDGEECDTSADAVAQMIQDLISAGGLDEDKLAKIVDIIASDDDDVEGDGLDLDGEVPEEVPSSEEDDLDADPELNGPVDGEVPDVQPDDENDVPSFR